VAEKAEVRMRKHLAKVAAVAVVVVACSSGGGSGPEEPAVPWRPAHSPTAEDIRGIWAVGEDDIWACGENGNILHYDGSEWRLDITTLAPDFFDVEFVSSSDGWVCGKDGWVARRGGGKWERVPGNTRPDTLYALDAHGADEAWFCGARGVVLHYQDGVWTDESPSITDDLYGIRVAGNDEGWVVGDNGRILKRSKGAWVEVTSPVESDYRCAFFVSGNEAWFGATDGFAVHLKGGGLNKTRLPCTETITGLYFKSDGRGYAVTKGGSIFVYSPAARNWRLWHSHSKQLYDITFSSEERGWAVGAVGTILRH
jgi:photosystem II stability/assembly factor-like uncharacterized protein